MSDDASGPDPRRAVLALLCVFGLVAASAAAPALAGETPLGGLDSPQAPSQVPEFLHEIDALNWLFDDPPTGLSGGRSLFGALNLGDAASVGGAIPESARAQSNQPHFVATAPGRTYWRTGAFMRYTGSGWEGRGGRALADPSSRGRDTHPGTPTTYTVELKRSATALPIVWKPLEFDSRCNWEDSCTTDFVQTRTGGIRAPSELPAGSTYEVTASKPPRSEARLTADDTELGGNVSDSEFTESSDSVSNIYTRASTTSRVRALTHQVTEAATNRYETAKAVENYLESEKTYSLSNGTASGDRITHQFLFEHEAGYCEHFATAMATMLRTQDVPARYVVGYAGGERVGENKYLVRGADAHAWVEVYFEDVGWVRFDPTPAAPRQAADEDLRGDVTYDVNLNQTATPGERVTATITAAGSGVPGVGVTVNGERVGVTDGAGEVAFTVPYAEELNVELQRENATAATDGGAPAMTGVSAVTGVNELADVPSPRFAQDDTASNDSEHTFPVDADVRFQFDEDVEPGSTVTLRAFVGTARFPNATVSVAGERVGQTDERGRLDVTIPADASGVVRLTASRGDISQTTAYPVDALSVSVSPSLVAPLPGTAAAARVTAGGEPVPGARVAVDGTEIGRTDADGRVAFDVPLARAPAVSASANGERAVTYVDGVLPTLAGAVLAAGGALAVVGRSARRRGVTLELVASLLARAVTGAASLAVRAVVGLADTLDDLAAEFRAATRDGWRGVLEWFASLPGRMRVPDVRAWLAGLLAAARGEEAGGRLAESAGQSRNGPTGHLRGVWRRFVSLVGVERWRTKTPGEVARRAVRSGFPRRPVYALTNAFRDAAYGDGSARESADRAASALDELDDASESGDGADEDTDPDGRAAEGDQ